MSNENDGEKTLVDTQLPASLLAELEERYQKHQRDEPQAERQTPPAPSNPLDPPTPSVQPQLRPLQKKQAIDATGTAPPLAFVDTQPFDESPGDATAVVAGSSSGKLDSIERMRLAREDTAVVGQSANAALLKQAEEAARQGQFDRTLSPEELEQAAAKITPPGGEEPTAVGQPAMPSLRPVAAASQPTTASSTPAELDSTLPAATKPQPTPQPVPGPALTPVAATPATRHTPSPALTPVAATPAAKPTPSPALTPVAPAPVAKPAPTPQPEPEATLTQGDTSAPEPELSPEAQLFALPELTALPMQADAIAAMPKSEGLVGSLGYAFQAMKAKSQITTCTRILTKRGTTLNDKKQDLFADLGQQAYQAHIRSGSTEAAEQQLAVTLKDLALKSEQTAAIEAAYREVEQSYTNRNASKIAQEQTQSGEVDRLKGEKSTLETRKKSLMGDINAATKAMETAQKKLEKLNSAEKKPENWQQQVDALQQELAENQNKLQSLTPEQQALDAQLGTVSSSLEQADASLKAVRDELAEEKKALDAAKSKCDDELTGIEKETRDLHQAARQAYEKIGFALWNNTQIAPQFTQHYGLLEQIDNQLIEDKNALLAFEQVRSQLRPDYAKKGWMIMGGIAGLIIALIIVLVIVL